MSDLRLKHNRKWVYWWASNLPRPVNLGRRSPGPPAPAQAGTRGAIKSYLYLYLKVYVMTNHLTGGPPAKLFRAFVYEFPNKFKPTNVLLKTTHGHVMRACDDMQVRYLNSL